MNLLLLGEKCNPLLPGLKKGLEESWNINKWQPSEGSEKLSEMIKNADVIIPASDALTYGNVFRQLSEAKNLKLIQIPFAGTEWIDRNLIPEEIMIANCAGHEIPISEYIIGTIIALTVELLPTEKDFRNGSWERTGTLSDPNTMHGEVFGKTLGIIGYGLIGIETAKRAKSLGMSVYGVNRKSKLDIPKFLDWHGSMDELDKLLNESDYIVLACDLNEQSKNLINKDTLSKMKKSSYLINISRGNVCNEEDLFNHLKENKIAGAAIDTWWVYPYTNKDIKNPRPSKFPFQDLKNIIMTPHNSAHTMESDERRAISIVNNLKDFENGIEPPGFVFYGNAGK